MNRLDQIATFELLSWLTPILAISETIWPYGYMAISQKYGHNAIMPYCHMAWDMANMGVYLKSNANVAF
jgi:hypothetical protein